MPARDEHLHIVLSAEERKMLETIAARDGHTISTAVRTLVRQEHRQRVQASAKRQKRQGR